jgi:hypothetical protein
MFPGLATLKNTLKEAFNTLLLTGLITFHAAPALAQNDDDDVPDQPSPAPASTRGDDGVPTWKKDPSYQKALNHFNAQRKQATQDYYDRQEAIHAEEKRVNAGLEQCYSVLGHGKEWRTKEGIRQCDPPKGPPKLKPEQEKPSKKPAKTHAPRREQKNKTDHAHRKKRG